MWVAHGMLPSVLLLPLCLVRVNGVPVFTCERACSLSLLMHIQMASHHRSHCSMSYMYISATSLFLIWSAQAICMHVACMEARPHGFIDQYVLCVAAHVVIRAYTSTRDCMVGESDKSASG